MNYCSQCGAPVSIQVPEGDNRPRHVCTQCDTIHYLNPKIVAGCLPVWEDKVLLCRRAIEPRHGLWTLPAGFMENDETTMEAAVRETHEEAGARVEISHLYSVINLVHINQVYMMFLAYLQDTGFAPGEESLETALFTEQEIPWDRIAFPVITETLRLFFADRRKQAYGTHVGQMDIVDREQRQFSSRFIAAGDRVG